MSDSEDGDDRRSGLTRRKLLLAAGGVAGSASIASGAMAEGDGHITGGDMALDQAHNAAGDLWTGPDAARSNVKPKAGRIYLAEDTQVDYIADGDSWGKMGHGSEEEPVPEGHYESLETEDVGIGDDVNVTESDSGGMNVESGSSDPTKLSSGVDLEGGDAEGIGTMFVDNAGFSTALSADQSIPDSEQTLVEFDDVLDDSQVASVTSGTITLNEDGWYYISGMFSFTGLSAGDNLKIYLERGDGTSFNESEKTADGTFLDNIKLAPVLTKASQGQTFEVSIEQGSGSASDLLPEFRRTRLTIIKVG